MEKSSRTTNTSIIEKENKDTPETVVENFFELLKNGGKPKKYTKEMFKNMSSTEIPEQSDANGISDEESEENN